MLFLYVYVNMQIVEFFYTGNRFISIAVAVEKLPKDESDFLKYKDFHISFDRTPLSHPKTQPPVMMQYETHTSMPTHVIEVPNLFYYLTNQDVRI